MPQADAYPLLPSLGSRASSRPGSRPPSRPSSRSSRPISRAEFRDTSPDLEAGPSGGQRGSDSVLFKAPDDSLHSDDDDSHDHDRAPLLSREDRTVGRPSLEDEIDIFADALGDGPAGRATGTLLDGIANMANSILGAGIIGLPYAIRQAGFVTGITLLIVLAAVTDWTIRLVVVNAKLSGRDSYMDVMSATFGRAGAGAVSFFQFAFAFGGMCAFNVIIGDSIPPVLAFVFPPLKEHAAWLVDRRFIIVICTVAVSFPLSLHRDIVKLSKSSGFALISMGIIVCSVVFRSVGVDPDLKGSSVGAISFIRGGVFEAIGVISFAFVCHHNTMFIYKSISVPTLDRFNAVTHTSTSLSLVCCLLMSVTGYLTFTDKTEGNILNNFSADDWVINIARLCFGANMSTTIPLENYVCREVLDDCFWRGKPFSRTRHVVSTCAIVFTAMFISLLTCDLGVVLEIAGGLSATALAFIFPAAAFFVLTRGPWNSRQKLPAVVCAVFGTIVLVMSTGIAISKTIRGDVSHKKCD
ncbi:hypothetical protein CcaverHIS002_0406110 [Cutaneotrichosporon cavernicola]|uniref:Amino acid transporter transmembrane domain-containing protein n=1 Tax=Cutaneotrichosporon cavernicola TaxID=279322 RepID=A0AA48L4I9_9TREE|nr:uncharacterized protein CcaverHIS019_0406130 [Cutaneotrichosporon cavernicola]BEI84007.1 hypothetical protein CcaverHIS002_0406110 [Cutaneotrichosporon cavernicola]BEI91793.1 hypothetical protein CcaverHIS019_0406130 [Cutaneotrichosporon cavernicola]BEI99565.1 hypothetical protein CcaverHIS631_0406080 [Cutaneotrichosporon cavernicola]BEJ07342.1 hypothetical protein CcaverHIS641_0406110 [Cutaneotrichosporon cavernicola]